MNKLHRLFVKCTFCKKQTGDLKLYTMRWGHAVFFMCKKCLDIRRDEGYNRTDEWRTVDE